MTVAADRRACSCSSLVNGFFVAAEFALVRARRARLEEHGARRAQRGARARARAARGRSAEYLSACQVGITLASLGIGFLGEPAIAHAARAAARRRSRTASSVGDLASSIAYVLVTVVHIIVGEQVPKIYAIQQRRERRAARRAAAAALRARCSARSSSLLNGAVERDPAAARHRPRRGELDEGGTPEELKLLIAAVATPAASSTRARRGCSPASSTCTSRRRAR